MLARAGDENFPVASAILGRRLRADLMAVYGFARLVDEIGDEAPGDRSALLDLVAGEIELLPAGSPRLPIMARLAETVRAHHISTEPFHRLVRANRQDQVVSRYETFEGLLGYCRLSADPVGRIVLAVLDASTPERVALSDRVCSALQVVEHLQDIAEDLRAGRIYLPQRDLRAAGCTEDDLLLRPSPERVRSVVATEARRAAALLDAGGPLVGQLRGRGRLAVAGFVAGGRATLAALAESGYAVCDQPPRPARRRLLREWLLLACGGGR